MNSRILIVDDEPPIRKLLKMGLTAQGYQILGIQRQGCLENGARLWQTFGLEQRLAENDVAAHVPRLLGQILLADENGLLEVAHLPILVGQRSEVPPRILVEFLTELVDAGGIGH